MREKQDKCNLLKNLLDLFRHLYEGGNCAFLTYNDVYFGLVFIVVQMLIQLLHDELR